MLKLVFTLFAVLFTTATVMAGSEVVLTGNVTSVEREWWDGNYKYKVRLLLQFANESDEPVIILNPSEARLTFVKDYSAGPSNSEVKGILWTYKGWTPSNEKKADPISDWLKLLAEKIPSEHAFKIIPAGRYFAFYEEFVVENGFTFRKEPGLNPKERPRIVVIPEFAGLRVEYRASLADRPEGVDRVLSAKRNWKQFGNLLIDDNGEYSTKSSFIPNYATN